MGTDRLAIDEVEVRVRELEALKEMLIGFATGSEGDDQEFRRIRRVVLDDPALEGVVPQLFRRCRTLAEFWVYIKGEASSYADRRRILRDAFEPLLEQVEAGTVPLERAVGLKLKGLQSEQVEQV